MRAIALVADLFFGSKLRETARQTGAELETVRTGDALLEHARRNPPDVVVIDLNAGGDPVAAGAAIRADPAFAHVRVVTYLSHVDAEAARRAREAGLGEVMARSAFVTLLPSLLGAQEN